MGARTSRALPGQMRAVVLDEGGRETRVVETELPRPGPGQLLVEVRAAPINPSDLAHMKGRYAHTVGAAQLGFEGAGVVVATGPGALAAWMLGRRVSFYCPAGGSWATHAVVDVANAYELAGGQGFEEGATGLANPLTAMMFLDAVRQHSARAVVLTAGASAIARMFARVLEAEGVLVLLVVRREEQAAALRAESDRYLVLNQTDPGFEAALAELAKLHGVRLCFECVGGELLETVLRALPSRSQVYLYGVLSMRKTALDCIELLFKSCAVRGFHLKHYAAQLPLQRKLRVYLDFLRFRRRGLFATPVSRRFALAELPAAVAHYKANMSAGKVLLLP